MTKQEAEPIILNLFYRDTGLTRTKNHGKEHENLNDLITLCQRCHEKEHNITPRNKTS